MYLILAPEDKRIMHISKTLDYNIFGGYVLDNGLHIVKGISEAVEVEEVPEYVEVEKYCYINNEFVINENYIDPEVFAQQLEEAMMLMQANEEQQEQPTE